MRSIRTLSIHRGARGRPFPILGPRPTLHFFPISAACAAANRAIGTRNGEHDT